MIIWKTKFKSTPLNDTLEYINEVCRLLITRNNLKECTDYVMLLWRLNSVVYASVAAWIIVKLKV